MPHYKTLKILAIDPGTREMGVALLENDKLIHYGVQVIKNRRSFHERLKEGRKMVLRLINDFKPNVLAGEMEGAISSEHVRCGGAGGWWFIVFRNVIHR